MSPIDPRDVQAIGWTLVHFVWQGTALAALLAALDLLLRHAPAPVRYRLASATLGLMLLLPLATFGILRTSAGRGPNGVESSATQRESVAPPSLTSVAAATANNRGAGPIIASGEGVRGRVEALLPVFVALWSAGVLLLSLRTLGGFALVQRLKRSGLRTPSPALVEMVARLKEALDVSAAVRVCESALVQVPTVVGWLRPVVLVPMSAVTGLTPQQIELILAHELAHVRRSDYLVNLLQAVAETLLFYHPAVWWTSHRMRVEREHCCDDLAVAACGSPVRYARALADLGLLLIERGGAASHPPVPPPPLRRSEFGSASSSSLYRIESAASSPSLYRSESGSGASLAMQATGGSLLDRVARLLAPPRPLSRASRGLASLVVVGTLGLALGVGWSLLRGPEWPSGTIHASMPTASDTPKHLTADDLDETVTKKDDAVTDEQCEKEPVVVADESCDDCCDECVDEPHVHHAESADAAESHVHLDVTAEVSADSRWADHSSFDVDVVPPVPPTPVVAEVPPVAAMLPHPPVPMMAPPALVPPVPMSAPRAPVPPVPMRALRAPVPPTPALAPMAPPPMAAPAMPWPVADVRPRPRAAATASASNSEPRAFPLERVLELARAGVTPEYIDAMDAAGFDTLSPEQLIALRNHGVDPEYIQELKEAGYKDLTTAQVVQLRTHGVSAKYIRELKAEGISGLSLSEIVSLRNHGINASFAADMKKAGLGDLSVSKLITLRSQGISGRYLEELKDLGYSGLSMGKILGLRSQGITPEYVRALKQLGYDQLEVGKLIALRSQGITPEFVHGLRDVGYANLPVGSLLALRAAGVTPEFVREMKDAGFDKLTPEELIELRHNGIRGDLLKRLRGRL